MRKGEDRSGRDLLTTSRFIVGVTCLSHERTPVLLGALATLRVMLQRPHVYIGAEKGDGGLVTSIPDVMKRLPNKEEVLRDCIAILGVLGAAPKGQFVESLLDGASMPCTLSCMHRFPNNTEIQLCSVSFFANLCSQTPQIGLLFVQCGNVADYVTRAMTLHPTHSTIAEGSAKVLAAMSEHEANHELLLGTQMVSCLVKALDTHYHSPGVVTSCLIAASGMVPSLDMTQRQALCTRVGKILWTHFQQQPSVVMSCAAFIVVLAESPNATSEFKMFCARNVVEPLGRVLHQIVPETGDSELAEIVEKALSSLAINKFKM